eukprot:CAMPEP_0201608490 /NCGR_PEP_ID=MMETSP0492-20130828/7514_1 /ASSEMBLY_ACC=CAM_ASM_000837 /TAXON_ID=420259 /ORGANISM="Thalassiosira gravida, Strain GMp14c1" /LENGTH=59 /DNA_ID=CAMNT_0048073289 /DNA_START=8 /DNA_END=184 /DNA_ORIENTATION=+
MAAGLWGSMCASDNMATLSGAAALDSASETKIELSLAHRDIITDLSTQLENPQGKSPLV